MNSKDILIKIGIALSMALVCIGLLYSGFLDFTGALLDLVTHLANEQEGYHISEHTMNTTGFWSQLYLNLIFSTWLLSSNWWIVLLCATVFIIIAFWVANLLVSGDSFKEIIWPWEDGSPVIGLGWVRFYYALAGIYISFNMEYSMGLINSAILLAPLPIIYLCIWNKAAILPALWACIVGIFMSAIITCIAWVALILIVVAFFHLFSSFAGGMSGSSPRNLGSINGTPITYDDGDTVIAGDKKYHRKYGQLGNELEEID